MDSQWTSKLRYGLQLWETVRMDKKDPKKILLTEVQKAQNKMLRVLEKKRISNRVPLKAS